MADWAVLGLGGDPVLGDPAGVRVLASRLGSYASTARLNTERLRGVASDVSGGPLQARGDYAAKYADAIGELPDLLGKLGNAYQGCADALGRYAGSLDEAVGRSRVALRRGGDAFDRFTGARRQADALMPPDKTLPWRSGPVGVAGLCAAITPGQADVATAGMDEGTRVQVRAAVVRAQAAAADQQTARRLADDAAALRDGAANRCVDEIDHALDESGIENKSWYEKAWDTMSAPFRSWDAFVDFCGKVAMVAGVIALFVSGPVGWALMAAAMVAGAVILADTLNKYAHGQAGLLDVGLAVLGVIPGGRGVFSGAKLAGAARGLIPGLARGGAKFFGEGAFGMRTAIPYGLTSVGGLRGALRSPAQFGRRMVCRAFKGDPVDVATGELLIDVTDWSLPGSLPLSLRRIHTSAASVGHRLGSAWVTGLDHRVEVDDAGVSYTGDDGTIVAFPHPADGQAVEPVEGARLLLRSFPDLTGHGYTVTDPLTGVSEHFTHAGGLPGVTALPLVATTDRAGRRIDYRYDGDGLLTGIEHSGGYRVRVDRTDTGLVCAFVLLARPGVPGDVDTTLIRYGYDAVGRLTEVVNSSGESFRYSYDKAGRLVRWQDRNGTWYQYEYDDQGRVVRADGTDAILRAQFRYEPAPASANGAVDAAGPARTVFTDSLGHVWTYETNQGAQLLATVDPTGARTTQVWDRYNRLLSTTDPVGRTTSHTYDDLGNRTSTTLPDGATVTTRYDEATNQPVQVRLPDDTTWHADYDPAGLLLSRTDPTGALTRYAYDDHGHLTTLVDALGHTTRVECDPAGLPVRVTDPLGAVTHVTRDAFGRPARVSDPLDATAGYVWTAKGLPLRRTDPDGAVWNWTYDAEDNLRQATDPAGRVTRYAPTPFDQTTTIEAPDGATTHYLYDTERRLASVVNPAGLTWTYTRDPRGLVVAETDYNGATTTYERDAAGQLTRRTNAVGQTIEYAYDARGQVVQEIAADAATTDDATNTAGPADPDAAGGAGGAVSVTRFEFDLLGRLVHAVNPGTDLTFTRDVLGRVSAETVNGRTLSSVYDPLGQRVSRRTPSGAVTVTEFDAAGRPTLIGTGRNAGPALTLDHDAAGNPTGMRFGATTLRQAFDPAGRLATQTLTAAGPALPDFGATGGIGDRGGPGSSAAATHAATPTGPPGAASGSGGPVLLRRDFGYSVDGLLTELDDLASGAHRYTHDQHGRITTATTPAGTETYRYDVCGNLTDAVWPITPSAPGSAMTDIPAIPDAPGPVDLDGRGSRTVTGTLTVRAGATTYTYDAAGRLIHQRRLVRPRNIWDWSYRYDAYDRLVEVSSRPGGTWRYSYDPLGRRAATFRVSGPPMNSPVPEQTWFTWDGVTLAETVHPPTGSVTTFDHRPGTFTPLTQRVHRLPLDRITADPGAGHDDGHGGQGDGRGDDARDQAWYDQEFYAIITDLVGAPTHLLDADGTLTAQPATTIWGIPLTNPQDPWPGPGTPLRFPGQYNDPETGLHHNYFRHYNPTTATYTTPDPLGLLGGPNPHTYVPNPLQWLDPLGLSPYGGTGAAGAAPKPLIIGENMNRVKAYAEQVGTHAYRPWKNDPFDFSLGMRRNERMIRDAMRSGRDIIDIGPDFARRAAGRSPSPFYNMERRATDGYAGYSKLFERSGPLEGGVPGLDF